MKCKVCNNRVSDEPVRVNFLGREAFPCTACGLCHESDGEIARSQSDNKKIIYWKDGKRVEAEESARVVAGICKEDRQWLKWKGLAGA
jgi:hypothetical protein